MLVINFGRLFGSSWPLVKAAVEAPEENSNAVRGVGRKRQGGRKGERKEKGERRQDGRGREEVEGVRGRRSVGAR